MAARCSQTHPAPLVIANGSVVNGGLAEVGSSVVEIAGSSGESVKFLSAGTGGLALDGVGSALQGKVSGFGGSGHSNHDQYIDFTAIGSGASVSYTSAASHTSGTLTVTSGGVSATVTLVGNYSPTNFSSSTVDGQVRITDPGVGSGRAAPKRSSPDADRTAASICRTSPSAPTRRSPMPRTPPASAAP